MTIQIVGDDRQSVIEALYTSLGVLTLVQILADNGVAKLDDTVQHFMAVNAMLLHKALRQIEDSNYQEKMNFGTLFCYVGHVMKREDKAMLDVAHQYVSIEMDDDEKAAAIKRLIEDRWGQSE